MISYRNLGWYPSAFSITGQHEVEPNSFFNQSTLTSPLNLSWTLPISLMLVPTIMRDQMRGLCLLASRPKRILLPFACQPRSSSLLYLPPSLLLLLCQGKKIMAPRSKYNSCKDNPIAAIVPPPPPTHPPTNPITSECLTNWVVNVYLFLCAKCYIGK